MFPWSLGLVGALQLALQPTSVVVSEIRGGIESCRLEGERGMESEQRSS